jgi:Lhr-like helicase
LALRKRFCRKFNFELQAAATDDAIVLSLSTSHSFELAAVARYLHSNTVRPILVQAMLDAPMFAARWRWITRAARTRELRIPADENKASIDAAIDGARFKQAQMDASEGAAEKQAMYG